MSSKQEIKNAFTNELMNTPQYQIVLDIKNTIMDEIARPNVMRYVNYDFAIEQTDKEIDILKMCFIIEFGNIPNINNQSVGIDMSNFLL